MLIKKINIFKKQSGFTLVELVVSFGIFVAAIMMATTIFKAMLVGQRAAIASQNAQESIRYFFETTSKEMRMARGLNTGSRCSSAAPAHYKVFNNEHNDGSAGDALYFENKDGECVVYELTSGRVRITRTIIAIGVMRRYFLTPDDVTISGLEFIIVDDLANTLHKIQPSVTIKMDVNPAGNTTGQDIKIQTTISSRYYE